MAVVALAACVLAARPGARADDGAAAAAPALPSAENAAFKAEVDAATAPFIPELEKLGEWCNNTTLIQRRSFVAETMILLSPDNQRARVWLRYKRQADGKWKRTSEKPFYDEKPEALPDWEKRRAAIADKLRAVVEPFLVRREDWRTAGVRARLLRALVAINPDDAELHARAGEVLAGKKWVLKESAATAEGRRRIRDAVAAASRESVAAAQTMKPRPSPLGACLDATEFALHSSIDPAEARDLAMRVVAARSLYDAVLGVRTNYRSGLAIGVFPNGDAAISYVKQRRDLSEDVQKTAQRCTTYWLTGREVIVCSSTAEYRMDQCVRQILSTQVGTTQQIIDAPGWIGEGVGMYLTWTLVGTRLTPFVLQSEYSDAGIRKELADPKCDWVQAVRKLVLEQSSTPGLKLLTSLPLNSMTADDTLMAYALGAYFLESRPGDMRTILEALKSKQSFHQALAEVCDVDADELEARFVRWLRETK